MLAQVADDDHFAYDQRPPIVSFNGAELVTDFLLLPKAPGGVGFLSGTLLLSIGVQI